MRRDGEVLNTRESRREREHCYVSCVETACLQEECCANKNGNKNKYKEKEEKQMVILFAFNVSVALLLVRVSNGDATGQTSNFVLFVATTLTAAALPGR